MISRQKKRNLKGWLGLWLGGLSGYLLAQQAWLWGRLAKIDPAKTLAEHRNCGKPGKEIIAIQDKPAYQMTHSVEDGIERIVYLPRQRRFETPILMQHGMWHGAWSWRPWQEFFAEWGWESHAYSLPGHAGSPAQRPIRLCTLDYYLGFLNAEIERLAVKPILFGHSMGGALAQWYFKYIGDYLPAAVFVAPWVSHDNLEDGLIRFLRLDPIGVLMVTLAWSATPFVRSPEVAARALISQDAQLSPDELHAHLGPESALVMFQHRPPYWKPPRQVKTPLLWLAAEKDTLIGEVAERRSAQYYRADYHVIPRAGHNLMWEHNSRQTAQLIHDWLVQKTRAVNQSPGRKTA